MHKITDGLPEQLGEAVGFPDSSDGKASAYNAGDLGFIPGLWRSPGEGKVYVCPLSAVGSTSVSYSEGPEIESQRADHPFQDCLVVQTVKSLLAIWKTWVWSLSREDPPEREMATLSSILAWKIPWMEESGRLQSTGVTKSLTRLSDLAFTFNNFKGPPASPCFVLFGWYQKWIFPLKSKNHQEKLKTF